MRIFSKILPIALAVAFLAPASFAADGIYERDLVRGFLALKGDLRFMKTEGVRFINSVSEAPGNGFTKEYVDAHVEIGAEYLQLRTWFDIDFMPITPERGDTEWFAYGFTWMWGYKLFPQNSFFNIIPAIGPGVELLNIRSSAETELASTFGPTLNLELELRLQGRQFAFGAYGGYKVVRHYNWDAGKDVIGPSVSSKGDINADRGFVGVKLSWTMLNKFQRREDALF